MPGMASWSVAVFGAAGGISMPGMVAGAAGAAAGTGIAISGIGALIVSAAGAAVGAVSMFGIAGMTGAGEGGGVSRRVTPRLACGAGRAGGVAFVFAGGFGLAGMVMPGIAMPPICWAGAMAGSNATAAAATGHLILIIGKTPRKG
jgi:hypothetical protein